MTPIKRTILDPEMAKTLEPDPADAMPSPKVVKIIKPTAIGLGDLVYKFAHPIGCWLDKRTARWKWGKTGLCGCSACSARRKRFNAWVPNWRHWKGGWQVTCSAVARGLLRSFLAIIDRAF